MVFEFIMALASPTLNSAAHNFVHHNGIHTALKALIYITVICFWLMSDFVILSSSTIKSSCRTSLSAQRK